MFGHRLFPGKTNWCIRLYISRRPRESTMRTKAVRERKNRTGWVRCSSDSSVFARAPAGLADHHATRRRPSIALSTNVRQTKDTYSIIVVQPSARLHTVAQRRDGTCLHSSKSRSNSSQVMTWSLSLPPFVNRRVLVPRTLLVWRLFTAAILRARANTDESLEHLTHPVRFFLSRTAFVLMVDSRGRRLI